MALRNGDGDRGRNPGKSVGGRRSPCSGMAGARSEEHTSELQSLMRISYAVFCLKKIFFSFLFFFFFLSFFFLFFSFHFFFFSSSLFSIFFFFFFFFFFLFFFFF